MIKVKNLIDERDRHTNPGSFTPDKWSIFFDGIENPDDLENRGVYWLMVGMVNSTLILTRKVPGLSEYSAAFYIPGKGKANKRKTFVTFYNGRGDEVITIMRVDRIWHSIEYKKNIMFVGNMPDLVDQLNNYPFI